MSPRTSLGLAIVVASAAVAAHAGDDRLLLSAPNSLGQQGLVRTTSARIDDADAMLGFTGRGFFTGDFVIDGVDAVTFAEGNAAFGIGLFEHLELSLMTRAATVQSSARVEPVSSLGDLLASVKGGAGFGVVSVAASARLQAPTRHQNRIGLDPLNLGVGGAAHVTLDLVEQGLPLRAHLNGGYMFQTAKLQGDAATNPFFFGGQDGALLALATQQWFFDHAHFGLGVEAPLPYVTPFVELWYETAIGSTEYAFFGDAWMIVTPGLRAGFGGLRVDVAVDAGLSGQDVTVPINGQPYNPYYAVRAGVSHSFDLFGAPGSGGGGGGAFARLEGCVTAKGAPVPLAVVTVSANGQPGPRLAVDDKGCISSPVQAGPLSIAVSAPGHAPTTVTAQAEVGAVARVDVTLTATPQRGMLQGFVTTKDDEAVEATVKVVDALGAKEPVAATGGAFELDVAAGGVVVIAMAPGHLARGLRVAVDEGGRRTVTLVLPKEPKKRSVTLAADRLEMGARVPFVFRSQRLQSTAGYLLDEIADVLHQNPTVRVSVEVHTDPSEAEDASVAKALTEGRALVVKDALSDLGIDASRIETAGYGITQLVGPPNDPKNRRVEILLVK